MKTIIIILLFLAHLFSQDIINKENIIKSEKYYYGLGISENLEDARDQALSELTIQIAVNVSRSFEHQISESSNIYNEKVNSILKTYSASTLKNVRITTNYKTGGIIEVFCYLPKLELEKIFNDRKILIHNICNKADEYFTGKNVGYALKYYYYAAILLNSIPNENITIQGINYNTHLPARLNKILNSIKFSVLKDRMLSKKEREITLSVTSAGNNVSLLDFNFWNGITQVNVQARDGLASFKLVGSSVDFNDLKLNVKYSYYESRLEFPAIADLWNLVNRPIFKYQINLSLEPKKIEALTGNRKEESNCQIDINNFFDSQITSKIIKQTNQFIQSIMEIDNKFVDKYYSSDTFLKQKIINYKKCNNPNFKCEQLNVYLNKTNSGYELRRIRVLHSYLTLNKQTTEYLVLDFSASCELIDFNLSISETLYDRFVDESYPNQDWTNRQAIIKFLEKYRTAYLTRNINMVDLMFDEDALIIIGRKITKKIGSDNNVRYENLSTQPNYEYLKMTKQKYLHRLKNIFSIQEDIFIDFASFDIVKKNDIPNIYGIEMRQNYVSTSYADEGYLFLLIDFNEKDPIIHIRAWQPNTWNEEALVHLGNFKILR